MTECMYITHNNHHNAKIFGPCMQVPLDCTLPLRDIIYKFVFSGMCIKLPVGGCDKICHYCSESETLQMSARGALMDKLSHASSAHRLYRKHVDSSNPIRQKDETKISLGPTTTNQTELVVYIAVGQTPQIIICHPLRHPHYHLSTGHLDGFEACRPEILIRAG